MTDHRAIHPKNLQRFALDELALFTKEGVFSLNASRDFRLFYVGRDDVHGVLRHLLSRVSRSLYLNMFGYDDEELNAECMRCARDASITTVITLDKSQAGGKHERAILDADGGREFLSALDGKSYGNLTATEGGASHKVS